MAHTSTLPQIKTPDLDRMNESEVSDAIQQFNNHAKRMEAEHKFTHEVGDRVLVLCSETPQIVVGRNFAKIYAGCDAHILTYGHPTPHYELTDEDATREWSWENYEDGVLPLDKDRPLTAGEVSESLFFIREALEAAAKKQDNATLIRSINHLSKLHKSQKQQIWAMLTPAERSAIKAALA